MRYLYKILIISLLILLLLPTFTWSFGRNKVQYRTFDWKILQTPHFDIYFYQGEADLARITADIAEKAYESHSNSFSHKINHRVPILVYNSSNDFQQTNVILQIIGEHTNGFAELLRNRIVIHFNGSYENYRHLIFHELVHIFQYDILYSNILDSVTGSGYLYQIPLWFMEGLAEWGSRDGIDTETAMFERDGIVNGWWPNLRLLDYYQGYIVYKAGQSLICYLDRTYGTAKIAQLMQTVRFTRNPERAIKSVYGKTYAQLGKEWHLELKRQYWPEIAYRSLPDEFSVPLTNHIKEQSFYNYYPSISPNGDKIAFFSDKDIRMAIYIMDIKTKKVIKVLQGESSGKFEQLHTFRSGLSWSPDGSKLTFVAKSGAEDEIYIIDVIEKSIIERLKFGMNGLFSPAFSPDGNKLVFVGLKTGLADLYLFDLETDSLTRLLTDTYDDRDPVWSPDGEWIAFSSDRASIKSKSDEEYVYIPPFGQYDIFLLNPITNEIRQITKHKCNDTHPTWYKNHIAFISDENNISNIWIANLEADTTITQLTDILGGCFTPSWSKDGTKLVFSVFANSGWDLYLMKSPLTNPPKIKMPPEPAKEITNNFTNNTNSDNLVLTALTDTLTVSKVDTLANILIDTTNTITDTLYNISADTTTLTIENISDNSFADGFVIGEPILNTFTYYDTTAYISDNDTTRLANELRFRDYKEADFKLSFALDMIRGGFQYDAFYGFMGQTVLTFSDILGNHRIYIASDFTNNIDDNNTDIVYYYLPRRLDYGVGVHHYKYYYAKYYSNGTVDVLGERDWGTSALLSYPFSTFSRLDLGLSIRKIERKTLWSTTRDRIGNTEQTLSTVPNISLTRDNVIWGMTGPVYGSRYRLSFGGTYDSILSDQEYATAVLDARKYFLISKKFVFAFRGVAVSSFGRDAQRFFMDDEAVRGYDYRCKDCNTEDDYEDYLDEFTGSKLVFINSEFRFPLINNLNLEWPIPLSFPPLKGALFTDIGAVWSDYFRGAIYDDEKGRYILDNIRVGFGGGLRMNAYILFPVVLKLDWAKHTDGNTVSKDWEVHFNIGAEY